MACFPTGPERTPRRAEGAHDPIMVRVLVLDDGGRKFALCSCDLCMIRETDVCEIRRQVGLAVPELDGPRLCFAASHSHSCPETAYLFGNGPHDPWVAKMCRLVAAAVVAACANLEPCTVSLGRGRLSANHNRRVNNGNGQSSMALEYEAGVTTGPCDEELVVVSFNAGGRQKAIVYNYTAHALTMGPNTRLYTADYPGAASRLLEEALPGTTALFTNGAAGNIHPRRCMQDDWDVMEETGRVLGAAVLDCVTQSEVIPEPGMSLRSETLTFPNRVAPSLEVAVELSVLALGPLAIALVPGEYFNEFQIAFKGKVRPRTGLVVGYANGWPGYIPTRDAYQHGGYGVDLCEHDPAKFSRTALPPGAGEALLAKLLTLASSS